jgi:Leucine-rich repeat (LRR) protein
VEQSPCWKANSHSASQKIRRLLWNQKVHCRFQKISPMNPVLRQMNPIWKANSHSASQKIRRFYGTKRFIAVFKKSRQWILSWGRWIQSTPSHFILKIHQGCRIANNEIGNTVFSQTTLLHSHTFVIGYWLDNRGSITDFWKYFKYHFTELK